MSPRVVFVILVVWQAALTYLIEQKKIPHDQLVVTSEEVRDFPLLERRFVLVTVLHDQPDAPQTYRVLVDPTSKAVEPDFDGILLAEQAAAQDKYVKFDPPLYDRTYARRAAYQRSPTFLKSRTSASCVSPI